MSGGNNQGPTLFGSLVLAVGGGVAAPFLYELAPAHPGFVIAAGFAVSVAILHGSKVLHALALGMVDLRRYWRATGTSDEKGDAGWLSEAEIRKTGMHRLWRGFPLFWKRRKGLRLGGIVGKSPVFLESETTQLIIGPAGSSKSTAAIMPLLLGDDTSALVGDVKGELYETTALYRAKAFGHTIYKLDPKDADSAQFNPLLVIAALVIANDPEALIMARGMVLQLLPEPGGKEDQNTFFRQGARALIVTVILAVIIAAPKAERTLATAYRVLNDLDMLHALLMEAAKSDALKGEIASMADAVHASAFGDDSTAKTFLQFLESAKQALEIFGPGGYLAPVMGDSTFSFEVLKEEKATIYITIDFASSEVLGKYAALMQWMAIQQLVAKRNNKPVNIILDECCNAPLYSLPKILTLLRSYGCKMLLATQDLDDFERVFDKHTLKTVLSESDVKQYLGGVRSQGTLDHLEKALGQYSAASASYNVQVGGMGETIARAAKPLMSAEALRRQPLDEQIIFKGNLKPIRARKVSVFAVDPWRDRIGVNALYGGKRRRDPVMLRMGYWRAMGGAICRCGNAAGTHGRTAHPVFAKPSGPRRAKSQSWMGAQPMSKNDSGFADPFAKERAAMETARARIDQKRETAQRSLATKGELLALRARMEELAVRMAEPNASETPLSDPDHPLRREYRMAGRRLSYLEKRLPEAAHETRHAFNSAAKVNLRIERDPS